MSGTGRGGDTRFQLGLVLTLSGAHFIHDIFTAFLAPLLPLLIPRFGLSLALAGTALVFVQLPSIANPLLGVLVDRRGIARWLVTLSPFATAVGVCSIGLASNYAALIGILTMTGVSVAAIHLAAPVLVAESAGDRLGRGTSFFMVGGELARTVGPLLAVQAVLFFGLEGLWRLIGVGAAASLVLWWRLGGRRSGVAAPRRRSVGVLETWRRMGCVLLGVFGILFARALMVAALTTFLPTMLHGEGATLWYANIALATFELAGAAGVLLAGSSSDRIGRRPVLLVSVVLSPLMLLGFLAVESPAAMFLALLGVGFFSLATMPVMMAVMLEHADGERATANGTFIMMSFAIRALVVPAVGALGDVIGLRGAFEVSAVVALLGVPFVFFIPPSRSRAHINESLLG